MMQEDDDFATPCPIFASIRRLPQTNTVRKCKSSPPPKRSKSSQSRKENVPPLKCKGESSLGFHGTGGCQLLDSPIDSIPPYSCSIESQLEFRDEVAIEANRPLSPPLTQPDRSERCKGNISSLGFHGADGCHPLDSPIDPNPPYSCSIESQLVFRDEVAIEANRPLSPPLTQPDPSERGKEIVSLPDFNKYDANLAFYQTFGGPPLDMPTDLKRIDSYSIESRLLSSSREHQVVGDEVTDEEEMDLESNSDLDLLIRLCSDANEDDAGICSSPGPMALECPVCNLDISDMDEAARQFHTNACLDRCDSPEISCEQDRNPKCLPVTDRAFSVESARQVAEWLRSLGLDKYEEAFTREEIDWDTLKWMTEEDLINIGVAALGPRKKIVQSLNELRKGEAQPIATEMDNSSRGAQAIATETEIDNSTIEKTKKLAASRLITDYFVGPSVNKKKCPTPSGVPGVVRKDQSHPNQRRLVNKRPATSRKPRDTPIWCNIPGTPFRVDAFRYLRRDCTHWFLSHFHADHYGGLTRSFSHGKIYCSMITARLVHLKIGIPWDILEVLPLNQRVNIDGVHVTCFDANHCPGSVLILFEPPNGKAVLHTGDFRFCEEIANLAALAACPIHTLILDTTYCNPQYDFPKQEAIIQFVIEAIQAETFHKKTLFLIGSYTIGKERVFLEVARVLRKKVFVTRAKLRILECLELPKEDMQWLTTNECESQIHVVPLWSLASFKRLKQLSNQYTGRFSLIVAFSPTGWSFGKGKKSTGRRSQQGTIIRYEVPYSEHSSFTELKQCVKLIKPVNIIPSVNNHGQESSNAMVAQLLS